MNATERERDDSLLRALRDGAPHAFRELHRRHAPRVRAQLTRLVGAGPERDDLAQQIFLDVHRAIPSFRGDAAFATFLHRIVANVARDHLRRRREPPASSAAYDVVDPNPSPERRARDRQELARLFALVGRLSPRKRVAFLLVTVEGLSYRDVAARVGAHAPAVKQRVLAARRELGELLADGTPRPETERDRGPNT
ncbi:MAG TPA: sigma-70 family RNA polymerase sigma factor [Haliangiales bacterium]|nr:sigma-70 family RNA polymerase sigma factor [Haliangiales bacterium]